MAIFKNTLKSLFGGNEEEDAVSAAPLSIMATSPRAVPEGTVDYGGLKQLLQQQLMQEQTERLRESRSSRADEFLAFASGLGRPTKTGSFGESLGYANEALARQSAESAKLRAAQRKIMLEYGVDIATLGIEEQKGRIDTQAKAADAPRPVTAADTAKFGPKVTPETHYMSGNKPVLIPVAEKETAPTMTALVGVILQKIIDKVSLTPEEQKVLDYSQASGTPPGYTVTPTGRLRVDPGFVKGTGQLREAGRPPPKAPPPSPNNPAYKYRKP